MILKPDKETLRKFNEIVKPYFMKIQSNKNQIRTLEKLRDTLFAKIDERRSEGENLRGGGNEKRRNNKNLRFIN